MHEHDDDHDSPHQCHLVGAVHGLVHPPLLHEHGIALHIPHLDQHVVGSHVHPLGVLIGLVVVPHIVVPAAHHRRWHRRMEGAKPALSQQFEQPHLPGLPRDQDLLLRQGAVVQHILGRVLVPWAKHELSVQLRQHDRSLHEHPNSVQGHPVHHKQRGERAGHDGIGLLLAVYLRGVRFHYVRLRVRLRGHGHGQLREPDGLLESPLGLRLPKRAGVALVEVDGKALHLRLHLQLVDHSDHGGHHLRHHHRHLRRLERGADLHRGGKGKQVFHLRVDKVRARARQGQVPKAHHPRPLHVGVRSLFVVPRPG
mmetsp:Transcript_13798/g.41046  ORF Transcript_13798/g.41046 Transcript_13798/m.41046 type:complete len:311 (+) Transcript_13798:2969-3901(+)